jgi:hypothetical protein
MALNLCIKKICGYFCITCMSKDERCPSCLPNDTFSCRSHEGKWPIPRLSAHYAAICIQRKRKPMNWDSGCLRPNAILHLEYVHGIMLSIYKVVTTWSEFPSNSEFPRMCPLPILDCKMCILHRDDWRTFAITRGTATLFTRGVHQTSSAALWLLTRHPWKVKLYITNIKKEY